MSQTLATATPLAQPHAERSPVASQRGWLRPLLDGEEPLAALLNWLTEAQEAQPYQNLQQLIAACIADIDTLLTRQLQAILHHSRFQTLEASWRGLDYLCEQADRNDLEQRTRIKLISISWAELSRDLNRAIEFDQSEFFKLIYSNELDMPGGEPFGVLIGDYQISHQPRPGVPVNDIDTLKEIARTAAAAFAPFVTSADPKLFGVDSFAELATLRDLHTLFDQDDYIKWRTLRSMDDARFLGITMPQMLMRAPYQQDGRRSDRFNFAERPLDGDGYLWGSSAYAFAGVLLRTFAQSGWFTHIRGMQSGALKHGLVCDLPLDASDADLFGRRMAPGANLQVGDRLEKALADNGFVPLSPLPLSEHMVFFSNAAVLKPTKYDSDAASVNARLSSMLQYVLCVSRFAHYIKLMGRDKVGSFTTAASIEADLQRWLHQYTSASDSDSADVRARFPLQEGRVQVKETRGKPGHFYSVIQLKPHFQLEQMVSTIRLVTELSPKYQTSN